jgi:hypothetical protein
MPLLLPLPLCLLGLNNDRRLVKIDLDHGNMVPSWWPPHEPTFPPKLQEFRRAIASTDDAQLDKIVPGLGSSKAGAQQLGRLLL